MANDERSQHFICTHNVTPPVELFLLRSRVEIIAFAMKLAT
jgi:hypothetical protein